MFVYIIDVENDIVKVVDWLCLCGGMCEFRMVFLVGVFGMLVKIVM